MIQIFTKPVKILHIQRQCCHQVSLGSCGRTCATGLGNGLQPCSSVAKGLLFSHTQAGCKNAYPPAGSLPRRHPLLHCKHFSVRIDNNQVGGMFALLRGMSCTETLPRRASCSLIRVFFTGQQAGRGRWLLGQQKKNKIKASH